MSTEDRRECESWEDGMLAVLSDGPATARLHRRLKALTVAGQEWTGFDLWASAGLYGFPLGRP